MSQDTERERLAAQLSQHHLTPPSSSPLAGAVLGPRLALLALDAFYVSLEIFDEQIRLHENFSVKAFPHVKRALSDNFEILQKRLKMLQDKKEELAKDLRRVNDYNRELDLEMNSLKPEIIQLYKQREQHQSWLLSHGARVEEVHKLLDQSRKEMAHNDEKAWLMPDVDRVKAEEMLISRDHGTFLIRWSLSD